MSDQSDDYMVQNRDIQYEDDDEQSEELNNNKIQHFESDEDDLEIVEKQKPKKRLAKLQEPQIKKQIKIQEDILSKDNSFSIEQELDDKEEINQKQKSGLLKIQQNMKVNRQNQENASDLAQKIIYQMENAYEQDRVLNQQQKPAIKKICLAKEIIPQLKQLFLQNNGFNLIEKWIDKMPDGSKPSQLLKQQIVEILNCFNFDNDFIPNSILGKFLVGIKKNKNKIESNQIIQQAKQLIDKWQRNILNNKINYKKVDNYEDEEIKETQKQKNRQNKQQIDLFNQSLNDRYVKIPLQKQFDFVVNAKSNVQNEYRPKDVSEPVKEIYRILMNRSKKN